MALLLAAGGSGISAENYGIGPVPVELHSAGNFAILTKTGITDVFESAVKGNVGTSPITGAALLLTCGEVSGKVYTVDAAGPLPCAVDDATRLTSAVRDMEFAYDNAAGRQNPDFTELGAGEIGGLTLAPGLYKWGPAFRFQTMSRFRGPDAVWIFQIAGTLKEANAMRVTLAGGAQARNIFWQVAGAVDYWNHRALRGRRIGENDGSRQYWSIGERQTIAQTAVTLQMNAVTEPGRYDRSPCGFDNPPQWTRQRVTDFGL